jgi:hypothetical protein
MGGLTLRTAIIPDQLILKGKGLKQNAQTMSLEAGASMTFSVAAV